jgi:hypothetical protein
MERGKELVVGRERERVDHIYLLVIEVEIEHRLPELQDVAVLVVLVMER